jgi:hypothetical protein
MKLEVVTVAVHPGWGPTADSRARPLVDSARRNGFTVTVLGRGERWRGNGMKLRLLREHLRSRSDDSIVLFADAFDSVLLPCRESILERFQSFRAPLVFSAEKGCWPDPHLAARYPRPEPRAVRAQGSTPRWWRPAPPLSTPFRYLNSGGYMGYVGCIRSVLEGALPEDSDSDQRFFTRYFLEHRDIVALDHESAIFQTLYQVDPADLTVWDGDPVRVRGKLTGTQPCVLHGNGDGRHALAALVAQLQRFGWP